MRQNTIYDRDNEIDNHFDDFDYETITSEIEDEQRWSYYDDYDDDEYVN